MRCLLLAILSVLALTGAKCDPTPPPEPSPPPYLLMRHFQRAEVDSIARSGDVDDFSPYDIVIYHAPGHRDGVLEAIDRAGRPAYAYLNVLTLPIPEWIGGGSAIFDSLDAIVAGRWDAELKAPDGTPAVFRWFFEPAIIDWREITPERGRALVDVLVTLTPAYAGFFWDQAWRGPAPWMLSDSLGATWEELAFGREDSLVWEENFLAALAYARTLRPVVVNGETIARQGWRPLPEPCYMENADWKENWPGAMELWSRADRLPGTVLSVSTASGRFVDSALARWRWRGGTLAFDGDAHALEVLYRRADSLRSER